MITTLGATVSKTFANALFNSCATSLPASGAAAGTVGVGATSGCAANDVLIVKHRIKMDKRMGCNLDSIEHATFNWSRPLPAYARAHSPFIQSLLSSWTERVEFPIEPFVCADPTGELSS